MIPSCPNTCRGCRSGDPEIQGCRTDTETLEAENNALKAEIARMKRLMSSL